MAESESFDSTSFSSEEEENDTLFRLVELEITQTFEKIILALINRRDLLLENLRKLKSDYEREVKLRNKEMEGLNAIRDKLLEANPRNSLVQSSLTKMKCIHEVEYDITGINHPLVPVPQFRCEFETLLAKIEEFGILVDTNALYSGKHYPYKSIGKAGHGKNEFNNPRGLFLDEKHNELYIVDCGNARIKVLNASCLEFKHEFGKKYLTSPWGISVYEDSIFVTDEGLNKILKFSLPSFKLVSNFACDTDGQFNDPRGICTGSNGNIYVAYLTTNRIAVFSHALKFIKYIGENELFHPHDVKFSTQTLYVLDESKYCIHLYNVYGQELSRVLERGDNCDVLHAIFFNLDSFCNIFISDVHLNSIKIFSKSGLFIHDIEEAFNTTKGLALTSGNQLIACSGSSHQIELY